MVKTCTAFYLKTYDLAFFALGTKVYYRDFTNSVTVDTGIALTAGTTTRFTEALGDVYLSNPTDGVYVIRCMRLNDAAANSGDATVMKVAKLSLFLSSGEGSLLLFNQAFSSTFVSSWGYF